MVAAAAAAAAMSAWWLSDRLDGSSGVHCAAGVADAVEKAMPATVRIHAVSPRGASSVGSGFVISEDGLVVTNNHVIEAFKFDPNARVELHFADQTVRRAKFVAADPKADIGLLKVDNDGGKTKFPTLKPGKASELRLGDELVVLGAPLGGQLTVSAGVLGNRQYVADDHTIDHRVVMRGRDDWSLLQIDARIMEGNSGGPVVNMNGDVVGVAVMGKVSGMALGSLGYAVSIDQAWPVIEALRTKGVVARGRVGLVIRKIPSTHVWENIDFQLSLPPSVPAGLQVVGVQTGSPAAAAGFQDGDVIETVNGVPCTTKGAYFEALGPVHVPGHVLTCVVHRRTPPIRPNRPHSHAGGAGSGSWRRMELRLTPLPDIRGGDKSRSSSSSFRRG